MQCQLTRGLGWRSEDRRIEGRVECAGEPLDRALDRKSTRLNSSHVEISYAVFVDHRDPHSFPTRRSSDLSPSLSPTALAALSSTGTTVCVPDSREGRSSGCNVSSPAGSAGAARTGA